ncbi:PXA domain-containing protein [Dendryphion nanum]|uniref:PXA domain-containing protein n=1 Tax=Dendryphion nanum TaxID=256645 RepID=A0A9P9D862_9PLEO|nr:PXA domain-containing protein [Dendryphion nanum]
MALKRRDVIIAAVAAFIAWGYLTHWQPKLHYLPYAFVTGAAATLVLQAWLMFTTVWRKGRGEVEDVYYGAKHVAFITPAKWKSEREALTKRSMYMMEPLYPASFVVSDSIDVLLGLILRDFVKSWYGNISKSPIFVNEVDRAIRAAMGEFSNRLLAVDLVETAVSRMVPMITDHLRASYEAERVVRGKKLSRNITESEELDLAIAAKYKEGQLHPAASLAYSNTKLIQQQHLRSIVARLLPKIMPRNMSTSPAVNVLIKEIVACAILFPVMQMLSDPDTWNQLMEGYGRTLLQERKTVRKLRAALDEQTPASPKTPKNVQFPNLAPHDNERKFERFIRVIQQTNTLADARRFRSEISSQLRKDSMIEGQDPVYLRRLENARRILDQKVTNLSAGGSVRAKVAAQEKPKHRRTKSRFENATLRDVLYDASGLSCFMEFMDRQNLMRLVQFWIVVDGFRNPLEQDTDDPLDQVGSLPAWKDSDRADLAQIHEAYLTKPELKILPGALQNVTQFLKAGRNATPEQYYNARRSLLQAQTAVYDELQEPYFRRFKKSDLYYKWLALDEAANTEATPVKSRSIAQTLDDSPLTVPSKLSRSQSAAKTALQVPDLRRAVVSSSDLKSQGAIRDIDQPSRRSLDGNAPGRAPLFDDEYDSDLLANSIASLNSDGDNTRANGDDSKIVDAMHAALTDIMGDEPEGSLFFDQGLTSPQDNDSMRGSMELPRATSPHPMTLPRKDKEKPSISSLGLIGEPKTRGVFNDDLFGDEEKFLEDEIEDTGAEGQARDDEIHEAAPGDLGLAEAIDTLTSEVERLVAQEHIVDSLTSKAELTNNAAELRILRKSKASLQREIERKELQRQQYIVQESENSLYGRATVFIQSIMVGTDEDGKEYALYVIEVRRRAGDHMPAAAWVITRRYSEFHELHKGLRAKFPQVRNLELPRRQMVLKLQKDFLHKRRLGLEKYLRDLLLIPAVCRSRDFRSFLSQQAISPTGPNTNQAAEGRDFVARIYSSVADGMEEFLGNIPVLDQLSVAGQNLISAATNQLAANGTIVSGSSLAPPGVLPISQPNTDAEAEAELLAFENKELEPFVKPICDLFLETFELNRENNWLRGRAVVVVLHQLLGGTIERKVRENFVSLTSEDNMSRYVDTLKGNMWPGGKLKQGVERTAADKAKSRKEAAVVLSTLVPELAASVVGRSNAHAASRKLLTTVNNQRLK